MTKRARQVELRSYALLAILMIASVLTILLLIGLGIHFYNTKIKPPVDEFFESIRKPEVINNKSKTVNIVYIKELDRNVTRTLTNQYYDKETNCYFRYNTEVSPNQWEYYYPFISDEYKTDGYGWMRYTDKWVINTANMKWKVLDSSYNDVLWHFEYPCKNVTIQESK